MSTVSKIESLLFISHQPLSVKKLASLIGAQSAEIKEAIEQLTQKYNQKDSGVILQKIGHSVHLVTAGDNAKLVKDYIKDETTGELTRPSLEALTIIAYRGPITKYELEQIRGVNCSLILRNLLMRGLIEANEDKKKMTTYYQITHEFLKFLGLAESRELPNFEQLHSHEVMQKLIDQNTQSSE
ncbi:MAG: SMC-Scp complex subunit ScpB [Candidatus Buchananbacteria bacterium CG10_big_fil_rev_8_21_14_0_10_42_9]|uniref:SMC-Scp complex subunit ScpB n=1 Tax=Candidatus Buchananbacteria bacterium CG10_big_fil_rev_8_21_14_0_10_42_9 TaxID=1974526 RepID=A0A2H0W264_9BACT|nr:MAG: SMC-Scp complex subunit ScpB [Candidatus Buchananbacteria bacterium CG10_big_fil_rev_8_21_14_0_10_42_9]